MFRTLHILVGALSLLAANTAFACQREPGDIVGNTSAQYIAAKMMVEAAYADFALAEARRPLDPGRPDEWQIITFRTIKRLKGVSPDRFTLVGAKIPSEDPDETLEHWVDEGGRVIPIASRQEPQPVRLDPSKPPPPPEPCGPGVISPEPGQHYVVYRGADGRALRLAHYHDGKPGRTYPVVKFRFPINDDWSRASLMAGEKWKKVGVVALPSLPTRADVVKVRFREPQSVDAVRRLLSETSARPFAVSVAFGQFIDEVRLPAGFADMALLDRAIADSRANLDLPSGRNAARQLLEATKAIEERRESFAYEAGIHLLNAEDRLDKARRLKTPGIVSVELVGQPGDWARLRSSVLVSHLLPGVDYRGAPATPPTTLGLAADRYEWEVDEKLIYDEVRRLAGD